MFQAEVLEPAAELIIAGDICEIRIETEGLQHAGVYPKRDSRISLFDAAERFSRDARPLCDRFSRVCTAQPSLLQPFAKAGKFPVEAGKQEWSGTWHMGNKLLKKA